MKTSNEQNENLKQENKKIRNKAQSRVKRTDEEKEKVN